MSEALHRLAYAERQFEIFRLRAAQSQLRAQVEIARGNPDAAERQLAAARNHLDFISDCNDTIDELRRCTDSDQHTTKGDGR